HQRHHLGPGLIDRQPRCRCKGTCGGLRRTRYRDPRRWRRDLGELAHQRGRSAVELVLESGLGGSLAKALSSSSVEVRTWLSSMFHHRWKRCSRQGDAVLELITTLAAVLPMNID